MSNRHHTSETPMNLTDLGIAADDQRDVLAIIRFVNAQRRRAAVRDAELEIDYRDIAAETDVPARRIGSLVKRYATQLRAEPLKAEYTASGSGAFGNSGHYRATRLYARAVFHPVRSEG